jgi:glycine betaine catabolism B
MNKNDNKKSANQWVRKLFRQSNATIKAAQAKTYFGHRYHNNHVKPGIAPFDVLFADADKFEPGRNPGNMDFQHFSEHGLSSLRSRQEIVEPPQASDVNSLQVTEDEGYLNLIRSASLSTQYTVLNCYDETVDTKTFRLGKADRQILDYLPGQYITLSMVIAGQEYKRSYSLASSPSHREILEITVKRDPNGGVVSNWLNDQLNVGDTITVKGPYGKFSCATTTPKKILFLAAGSGIVPIMSMLRWLADTESSADVLLILSFRTLYDIIYHDELNLITARHKNIKLVITLTKEPMGYSPWSGKTERITTEMIASTAPDLSDRAVYLCGPETFMVECKQSLQKLKLPDEQIFCESFSVNNPVVSETGVRINQPVIPNCPSLQSIRKQTGSYQVRFAKSGKTIAADGTLTLLELAEKSGIYIGHECRSGNCSECMIKCLKGNVEMTAQSEIDDLDRKKGWAYACCAYPASNLELDV